jgi:hypothetical protein
MIYILMNLYQEVFMKDKQQHIELEKSFVCEF